MVTTLIYLLAPYRTHPLHLFTRTAIFIAFRFFPHSKLLLGSLIASSLAPIVRPVLKFRSLLTHGPTNSLQLIVLVLSLVAYFDQSFSDSLLQEGDYLIDFLQILIILSLWVSKKDATSPQFALAALTYIACLKGAYFYDSEQSLNIRTDP